MDPFNQLRNIEFLAQGGFSTVAEYYTDNESMFFRQNFIKLLKKLDIVEIS